MLPGEEMHARQLSVSHTELRFAFSTENTVGSSPVRQRDCASEAVCAQRIPFYFDMNPRQTSAGTVRPLQPRVGLFEKRLAL